MHSISLRTQQEHILNLKDDMMPRDHFSKLDTGQDEEEEEWDPPTGVGRTAIEVGGRMWIGTFPHHETIPVLSSCG